MVTEGRRRASLLKVLLSNPKRLLLVFLISNTLVRTAAATLLVVFTLDFTAQILPNHAPLVLIPAVLVFSFFILIIGEIIPRTLSLKTPEAFALLTAKPVSMIVGFFRPAVSFFNLITVFLSRLVGVNDLASSQIVAEQEMRLAFHIGAQNGSIKKDQKVMLENIVVFSETVVREIMTPRPDTVCIDATASVSDVILLISEKGHSRIPVYEEKIDNIIGTIYAKDLLGLDAAKFSGSLRQLMREPIFIPESKNIEALFYQMKRMKFHLAIVVDEYGGMSGIVTLEDIIEEIIGDIEDEYDKDRRPEFIELSVNRFLADGQMSIDDLADRLEIEFPEGEDYDTIGGFVLQQLGRFPVKNEVIRYQSLDFIVKESNKRRILSVEIQRVLASDPLKVGLSQK